MSRTIIMILGSIIGVILGFATAILLEKYNLSPAENYRLLWMPGVGGGIGLFIADIVSRK